jgi:chromosome segregation ATPase
MISRRAKVRQVKAVLDETQAISSSAPDLSSKSAISTSFRVPESSTMSSELTPAGENWREEINKFQGLLDELRPRLIEAEANFAERLALISAFEFQVRARLEPLTRRLDDLQAEIDELRQMLRRYRNDVSGLLDDDGPEKFSGESWRFDEQSDAAASGGFRYRAVPERKTVLLKEGQLATLKQLYRQLARRFHPDLALDEADRAYRTDMMMAINAAYTAGDVDKLQRLSLEPSYASTLAQTDQELAESLQREVERCQRRLLEIEQERATLDNHDSTRLMKRAERAAALGRDLLDELAGDLRRRISEKLVERDVLEEQLEEVEHSGGEMSADDLADIVYNLGLEQAGDDGLFTSYSEWRPRNRSRWDQKGFEDEENTLDEE